MHFSDYRFMRALSRPIIFDIFGTLQCLTLATTEGPGFFLEWAAWQAAWRLGTANAHSAPPEGHKHGRAPCRPWDRGTPAGLAERWRNVRRAAGMVSKTVRHPHLAPFHRPGLTGLLIALEVPADPAVYCRILHNRVFRMRMAPAHSAHSECARLRAMRF